LALALNAPVQWVAQHLPGKRRGNRSLATLLSVLLVFAVLIGFLASIVPPFVRQVAGLVDAAPSFVNDLRNENTEIGNFVKHYNLQGQVDSFSDDLSNRLQSVAGSATELLASIGSSTFALLTVLVLTFMMLVEGPRWVRIGEELVPEHRREHVRGLTRAMYKVIKGYVNGQVLLAAIAAVLILPVLFILNISYPIALMVVVFVCGLIPMVGHTIGAVIVTAVALFTSPVSAAIVLAYYILYQQIENYLIQPRVQANSTNMSPLLVFTAVVIGVNFGGLLGGLVAIPIMGCIRILTLDQLTRRNLLESHTAKKTVKKAESTEAS
jgi:predicted PurR-regulated permease PerM